MSHKCIFDSPNDIQHPYGYCIRSVAEMYDKDKTTRKNKPYNMHGLTVAGAAFIKYAESLILSTDKVITDECRKELGNRYLVKTSKVCPNGETLYKYMDNF